MLLILECVYYAVGLNPCNIMCFVCLKSSVKCVYYADGLIPCNLMWRGGCFVC